MTALAPITVNDRESTPVAHTFSPAGMDPITRVHSYVEMAGGVPIGMRRITQKIWVTKDGGRKIRVSITWPTVVTEIINGVNRSVVDHTNYMSTEASWAKNSTTQERKNVTGIMEGLLKATSTQTNGMLIDLEDIW